jgi:hypothetical protein
MLLESSKDLSAAIKNGGIYLPLLFVMVSVELLNRYTRPEDSGEIDEMMQSLDRRLRTLGHKGVAGMYLVHLYL